MYEITQKYKLHIYNTIFFSLYESIVIKNRLCFFLIFKFDSDKLRAIINTHKTVFDCNVLCRRAAVEGAQTVSMGHLEEARDKLLMGPARRSRLPDDEANAITACHEGGHAVVAYYTKVHRTYHLGPAREE